MQFIDYGVLEEQDLKVLQEAVIKYLRMGYSCAGGVTVRKQKVYRFDDEFIEVYYLQAMVKEAEINIGIPELQKLTPLELREERFFGGKKYESNKHKA